MTGKAKRRRRIAAAAGAMLVVAATFAGIALRGGSGIEERPPSERPDLLLLTGLPIVFGETFSLDAVGSPALAALQARYRVVPISAADRRSLDRRRLLLMAQPQAQPAEMLVELDEWVRRGGRILLVADPVLEWPSARPLGDVLRPPTAFADTGLLGHWGLRLDAPDSLGPATFAVDGRTVHASSPGSLEATGPGCTVKAGGLVAHCRVGLGQATVIADADFLDLERQSGRARSDNSAFLLAELERLER